MKIMIFKVQLVVILLCSQLHYTQQQSIDDDLLSFYEDYTEMDRTILRNLTLDQIEWIETNKSGVGGGMRSGSAGLIRIKTRPASKIDVKQSVAFGTYEIPLKFSVAKKFYIPEYVSYDNSFFDTFGVIDWFPNVQLDEKGHLNFKITHNQIKEFKIIVEGIVDDTFVYEAKTITLN